jgi:nucleoside-diphosphate-sugar epimerase
MSKSIIVLAGATGNLGGRIAKALLDRGAEVRAVVRRTTAPDKLAPLQALGVTVAAADWRNAAELTAACAGASCVVSALNGLREAIVDAQTLLLDAAVRAGVPRFIPSDYSLDFTKLPPGTNRNLDLRREFHGPLEKAAIAATSVLNGAFAELLTAQMPMVLFKWKRVLYWGNADQKLDFTTIDNTAAFTAAAALDPAAPRFLRIAGDQLSARDMVGVASDALGAPFRLFRAGGLGMLGAIIKIARTVAPAEGQVFPPWQGMQYMHNMFDGRGMLAPLDNERYPGIRWTKAGEVLATRRAG